MKRPSAKLSAVLVAVALVFSLAAPKRAEADSAAEITLYVVGGIAIFAGLVVIGTLLTRDESKMFFEEPEPVDGEEQQGVHVGMDCRRPDGTLAVLCW